MATPAEPLPGIHHVTAITGDAQRNVDFYVGVLGLRLVKKTVNFDVPNTYHIYYGDRLGTPGSAMTFFAWPHLEAGPQGTGQVSVVSFAVPPASFDYWVGRLSARGAEPAQADRFDQPVLAFADPDGMALEMVGSASEARWAPWSEGPVPVEHAIRGFHSVTLCEAGSSATTRLMEDTMEMRSVAQEGNRRRYELGDGGPGATVDVLDAPDSPRGEEATGTVHHVAWRARDDAHQLAWRGRLVDAGLNVTPVIDRKYFHSIYFREPGGVLFEIATEPPGFTVDEPEPELGSQLQLPPQLEGMRVRLDLPPLELPVATAEEEYR
jgi:glyoxalase family protein